MKSVDWHPTKGLIVSGSKDHLVKLWDPRTSRCLTTLHGHKNTISKSLFQPTRGDLLATCARDQTCRIFDLRAMKDFCVLRGHEKDISTLAWNPIHPALISTGGSDGAINHYLLDETPQGSNASHASSTIIYPAASIPYAHEYAIWSMEYHPLGHILCSGSNDRITRFWTRPRPGEIDGFRDRHHIGDEAAAAMGTYDRHRRRNRQEEEEEEQDEADALVDQKMPLPGQHSSNMGIPGFPNMPGLVPPPLPIGGTVPGLGDLSTLAGLFSSGKLPPPPLPLPHLQNATTASGGPPPPPLPIGSSLPPAFIPPPPISLPLLPPPLPPNFGTPVMAGALTGIPGIPGLGGAASTTLQAPTTTNDADHAGGGRARAPLPSQKESLREAQGFRGSRR